MCAPLQVEYKRGKVLVILNFHQIHREYTGDILSIYEAIPNLIIRLRVEYERLIVAVHLDLTFWLDFWLFSIIQDLLQKKVCLVTGWFLYAIKFIRDSKYNVRIRIHFN